MVFFSLNVIGKKEGVRVEGRKEKGRDLRLKNGNDETHHQEGGSEGIVPCFIELNVNNPNNCIMQV